MKKILDWDLYCQTARNAIAEGCVLLENKGTLPLKKDSTVSVFGRIQSNYYKSGTGSGGKVNVTKVWNIVEGLEESGLVKVNQELKNIYTEWEKDHPYDEGMGWGKERWCQDEMPLTKEIVSNAAARSDVALVIIVYLTLKLSVIIGLKCIDIAECFLALFKVVICLCKNIVRRYDVLNGAGKYHFLSCKIGIVIFLGE